MLFAPDTMVQALKLPSTALTEEKSQEIFDRLCDSITTDRNKLFQAAQNTLLAGDRSQEFHLMSRAMMQNHIDSYWQNFHPQLPICMCASITKTSFQMTDYTKYTNQLFLLKRHRPRSS
jgi:hypothetical protein